MTNKIIEKKIKKIIIAYYNEAFGELDVDFEDDEYLTTLRDNLTQLFKTSLNEVVEATIKEIADKEVDCELRGYKLAIEEIRKEVESKKTDIIDCSDFHDLKKGFAWTPCGHCGLRRDEKPKKTKLYFYYEAHNQALEDIKTFLNKLDQNNSKSTVDIE